MVKDKGKGKVDPREEERLAEARRIEEKRLRIENEPISQDFLLAALERDYHDANNNPFWGGHDSLFSHSDFFNDMNSQGNPSTQNTTNMSNKNEEDEEEEERRTSEGSNQLGLGSNEGGRGSSSQGGEHNIVDPQLRLPRGRRQRAANGFIVRIRSK